VGVNHRTPDQVIAGLLRLVHINQEGNYIRRLVSREDMPAFVWTELEPFNARRLLTTDRHNDSVVIGVTHEAFFSAWPPFAAAINAAAAALRARRVVELAAVEWDEGGRPSEQLWEGGQLAAAVGTMGARVRAVRSTDQDPPAEPDVRAPRAASLRRSRRLVSEKVDLSPRAREFLHRSIRRDRSRRWRTTTVLSLLLLLAVSGFAAASVALRQAQAQRQAAQQQLRIATARQLISEASTLLDNDPQEALQLGIAAQSINDSAETRARLVTSLISTTYAGVLKAHEELVGALAFSPDQATFVTGSDADSWRLWDFNNGRPKPLHSPLAEQADVNSVAFSEDGSVLACALADGTVHLWSLDNLSNPTALSAPFRAHDGAVRGVAFGPLRTLVSGGEDGRLRMWDIRDPASVAAIGPPLDSDQKAVRSLAVSSNKQLAATGGVDATVRVWRLSRHGATPLGPPLKAHGPGMVRSLAFSRNGQQLASAGDDHTARIWDVKNPAQTAPVGRPLTGHEDEVTSVAFDPRDPNQLVTGSDDQRVLRSNVANPDRPVAIGQPLTGAHDEIYSVTYSPDGTTVLAGVADGTLVSWQLDGTLPAPVGPPLVGHKKGVDPVVFNPSGTVFATASEDGTVRLYSLADRSHRLLDTLRHEDEVGSAAFSEDDPNSFAIGSGETIQLWDVKDPSHAIRLGTPLVGHKEAVVSLAFCRGKHLLASGDERGEVRLWKLKDDKRAVLSGSPLQGNDDAVDSVACSPDGNLLAVAGTGMVKLWGLRGETPIYLTRLVAGHGQAINSVAFNADNLLAAAADDGTVLLFDVNNPNQPSQVGPPLRAHGDPVTSIAFSPDDPQIMVTAAEDKSAQVWQIDGNEARPIGPRLLGHQKAVNSVAIGRHGGIGTGAEDRTARLWTIAGLDAIQKDPIAHACSRTGQGLSPEEWTRLIPTLPYQKTCPG
jgi:WD40 repeat protein